MRPLMATFLDKVIGAVALGTYDERLSITLDARGHPFVDIAGAETVTKVVSEPADDHREWSVGLTLTAAPKEDTDDDRPWATATETRIPGEPADDERTWTSEHDIALPPADDMAVGLVSF